MHRQLIHQIYIVTLSSCWDSKYIKNPVHIVNIAPKIELLRASLKIDGPIELRKAKCYKTVISKGNFPKKKRQFTKSVIKMNSQTVHELRNIVKEQGLPGC